MKILAALLLTVFLANMAFSTIAQAGACPTDASKAEGDLLLNEGPAFLESKKESTCLRALINREMKSGLWKSEKELVADLMKAAWKAELVELTLANQ